ncbi:MAG: phytoene desaturase family protein [Candidatus Hodarchaeales archaeon]|jgi:phytoene desaturase
MEEFESDSYTALQRYLKEGETNYKIGMSCLIDREFNNIFDFFNLKNLYLLFKLKVLRRHYKYMNKFFKDSRLKEAFTYQDAYLGLNPIKAPSIFSMLPYLELVKGVWLPKGGMYSLITAIKNLSDYFGVEYLFNSTVTNINVKNNLVTGVTINNHEKISGDIIIANADLSYVYNHLLPRSRTAKRLNRKKYSCSTIMFYWGVDKQFSQLATHNIFMTGEYKLNFKKVMDDHTLSDDPSFYVHSPINVDNTKAPINHDSITVAVPVGHSDEQNSQNWNELLIRSRKIVIERISEICGSDFENHIKIETTFTPEDWKKQYNLTKGSALGLGHNLFQLCYFRPKNKHKKYHNLYFVGSRTHPGSGVPSALISAKLVCKRIFRDLKT